MNEKLGTGGKGQISGKNSFVNRTIRLFKRLPAEILGALLCKQMLLKRGLGKGLMW